MTFELTDIKNNKFYVQNILSYEILSETGAACDSLRLVFVCKKLISEIVFVKAFENGKLIFNGNCDMQKTVLNSKGYECFVYARSSAAFLVDNEAMPCEYTCPSAEQLFICNAREFGFASALPDVYSQNRYLVSKGKSCFAAINDFVYAVTGKEICVTPENVIKLYEKSKEVKHLDECNVTSVSYIINRSEPISCIDYKINSQDGYDYHFESELAEKNMIKRKRLLNLSAIAQWQRESAAVKKIRQAMLDYHCAEIVISGKCSFSLYDSVLAKFDDFGINEEFFVCEIARIMDKNGERTKILLKKEEDAEVVNYVD